MWIVPGGNTPLINHTPKQRQDLQAAFAQALGEGDSVRFDPYHRELYSTDASNHRVSPIGVVIPRTQADISRVMAAAVAMDVPVLPRGAGTSLAGQAIGQSVIIDCGKNLNSILDINPDKKTAIVEPGVTCLQLNKAAFANGLSYGPDPASADRATFGGMIGNNATGAHSIVYGMSADHIIRLWVTLADGTETVLEPLSVEGWRQRSLQSGLEGAIYRATERIRQAYRNDVENNWPKTWRRASGYNLNYLMGFSPGAPPSWSGTLSYPPHEPTNLAPLMAGSEGTLALIRQAEVRLVPTPAAKVLVLLTFASVLQAVRTIPELLDSNPAAIELIPRTLLTRAATIPAYARKLTFLDQIPEALLAVEFTGNSKSEALAKAGRLHLEGILLEHDQAQADLWAVRKAGLGLLMSVPGHKKPITFIEDVAVPVDRLAEYVAQVELVIAQHDTSADWYAHASAGCLHLRPMVNLRTQSGVAKMRSIADQVAAIVFSLNGSMSGEHGDGLSHTEFNRHLFGPRLTQAFHELKRAFDPDLLLNPGKVVVAPGNVEPALDQNLRFGPKYESIKLNTYFDYPAEGDLAGAVEACVGLGVCRKEEGLMCPSFQATREEADLTRGRANALRAALSGNLPADSLTSEQMHAIYDLCLECKGCKAECPTGVDIAKVKAEYLALYGQEHGFSLRSRIFANIRSISRVVHRFGPLINFMSNVRISRIILARIIGIASARKLPPFVRIAFSQQFGNKRSHMDATKLRGAVILFLDSYTEYNYPEIGWAAVRVLESSGYEVSIAKEQVCCGRPMISKGLLMQAKEKAARNIEVLSKYVEQGIAIVGLEPSCISAIREEYLDFFPEDPRAKQLAQQCFLIEEFLTQGQDSDSPIDRITFNKMNDETVKLHTHCHTKAMTGSRALHTMLSSAGYKVEEIDSGCCGMAGSFGYEAEHYKLSNKIAEMRLLPAVRQARRAGQIVTAQGISCRTQISDGASCQAGHPIQLVADRLMD